MKILRRNLNKDKSGEVTLLPEHKDDLYCIHAILTVGDLLTTHSTRKVNNTSSTGTHLLFKTHVNLTLKIETIEYDPTDTCLRTKGKNQTVNEHVQVGQYHTHDVTPNKRVKIYKDYWDGYYLDRLGEACNAATTSDVAALLIQEGLANLFLINKYLTTFVARIKHPIPRKHKGFIDSRKKAFDSFYQSLASCLEKNINFDVVKCIIVAGPGFYKDDFLKFISSEQTDDNSALFKIRNRFLTADLSSAFRHSLTELLQNEKFTAKLGDTKAIDEAKALGAFYQMIETDPFRAFYGLERLYSRVTHVEAASRRGAIETLLVSDDFLGCADIIQRKRYLRIVSEVKKSGGTVRVFSGIHETGKELNQYSGIAAILRYPVEEIEHIALDDISNSLNEFTF